jgi:hypothetical protein
VGERQSYHAEPTMLAGGAAPLARAGSFPGPVDLI